MGINERDIPRKAAILEAGGAIMVVFALFCFIIGVITVSIEIYPYLTAWHKMMLVGGVFLIVGVYLNAVAKQVLESEEVDVVRRARGDSLRQLCERLEGDGEFLLDSPSHDEIRRVGLALKDMAARLRKEGE